MRATAHVLRDGEMRVILRIKPTYVRESSGGGGAGWRARQTAES